MTNAPKSSFELAMERLRAADRESGVEEKTLTDAQKAAIAEARSVASSRLAEREILDAEQRKLLAQLLLAQPEKPSALEDLHGR